MAYLLNINAVDGDIREEEVGVGYVCDETCCIEVCLYTGTVLRGCNYRVGESIRKSLCW